MDRRHRGNGVVELGDQAGVEIEAAHLGNRVDEVVERPWRRSREEKKDRLRTDCRQHGRATQAMKLGTAPEEEPSEPPDGEPDVGDGIRNVQDGDQALSR